MPAETMPAETSAACAAGATMNDSEVVAAVRGLSVNGTSGSFDLLGAAVACSLARDHPGDCAGRLQMTDTRPGRAWLRWGGTRRVERLAGCAEGGCELYRDHPGRCGRAIPWPDFAHCAYGVELTWLGEEGGMAARYHIPDLRFLAACNHLGRSIGLCNADDEPLSRVGEWLLNVKRVWALPVMPEPCGEGEWELTWDGVTAETPGAFAMTAWEP